MNFPLLLALRMCVCLYVCMYCVHCEVVRIQSQLIDIHHSERSLSFSPASHGLFKVDWKCFWFCQSLTNCDNSALSTELSLPRYYSMFKLKCENKFTWRLLERLEINCKYKHLCVGIDGTSACADYVTSSIWACLIFK